jgi:hypothetical protein
MATKGATSCSPFVEMICDQLDSISIERSIRVSPIPLSTEILDEQKNHDSCWAIGLLFLDCLPLLFHTSTSSHQDGCLHFL